jgi:hypothetical protein
MKIKSILFLIYRYFIRYILIAVGTVLVIFLSFSAWFYATCPVYRFAEPSPFSGKNWYNPYQNVDTSAWRKCIFHLHSESWMGLTNGENTSEEVLTAYKELRYDVVTISDYMSINRTNVHAPEYISAYEHGYGTKKAHQLVLETDKVLWRDYIFTQNLNQKQHIIDLLKKQCRLLVINHPNIRGAYPPEDFKYLSGYDLFELQNGVRLSEEEWDSALSHGHCAWLIANDDAHNVNNPHIMQREVTFVNAPVIAKENILKSLEHGIAFGVHFPRNDKNIKMDYKRIEAGLVSFPSKIQLHNDTLQIAWHQSMSKIEFVGQNGQVLKTVTDSDTAYYLTKSEDTYVRVRLASPEGFVYYLNPIVRCTGDYPEKQMLGSIDVERTSCKRTTIAAVFLLGLACAGIALFLIKKKKCRL